MVKERFADWSRTEEPGYLPKGLPRAKRNPLDPVAHPAPAAAVGGRSRGEPARSQRPPACGRASRAVTTVAAPTRRTPPARARARTSSRPDGAPDRRGQRARRRASPPRPATSGATRLFSRSSPCSRSVSAVVFHVVLAQHQLQLDHLNSQITKEQRTYEQRRLTASLLASPQRIIQEAERLGLVVPPDPPQYLYVDNAPLPGNDDGSTADTIATGRRRSRALAPSSRDLSGGRRSSSAPRPARVRRARPRPGVRLRPTATRGRLRAPNRRARAPSRARRASRARCRPSGCASSPSSPSWCWRSPPSGCASSTSRPATARTSCRSVSVSACARSPSRRSVATSSTAPARSWRCRCRRPRSSPTRV